MANEFNELARVIDSVSKDKGIEKETILEAVNESVVAAAHKLMKLTHLIKIWNANSMNLMRLNYLNSRKLFKKFLMKIWKYHYQKQKNLIQMFK